MLVIRLTRKGKKNQPFFRVVVTDKRNSAKGGRVVEDLGYKNPLTKKISLNKEKILYWISKGAKPSASMHNLLVQEKIIEGKKINVSKKSKKPASAQGSGEAKPAEAAVPVAPIEAPNPEEKPVEQPKPAASAEGSVEPKEEKPAEEKKEEQK